MRKCCALVLSGLFLVLGACAQPPRGAWTDEAGAGRYVFGDDGQVSISLAGAQHQGRYTRQDERVRIELATGSVLEFQLQDDGSLLGPMGVRLRPVDE